MGPTHVFLLLIAVAQIVPGATGAAHEALAASNLHGATQALCKQAHGARGRAAVKKAQHDARDWAMMWDAEDRPQKEHNQLLACLPDLPIKTLVLATIDDLTGAWQSADSRCQKELATVSSSAARELQGELWRCRAAAAVHQGQINKGVDALQAGLKADPANPELYVALAQAQLAQDLPHSAHRTLLQIMTLDGGAEAPLLARAKRMADEAKKRAAPPLTPLDVIEQADLEKMMESGNTDEDDLDHVRELAQQTEQPQLWSSCALILLRGPDPALGRELLARAERALPLDSDPSRLLAVYHLTISDYPAALTALLRAVRKQPFDAESHVMLASVASKLQNWDVSHSAYKALVLLEPTRDSHKAGLSDARAKLRQHDEAAPKKL